MSDWISVKDRLPPVANQAVYGESDRVIVRIEPEHWAHENSFAKAIFMPNGDFIAWQVDGFNGDANISYWKPDSEPPAETDSNDQKDYFT